MGVTLKTGCWREDEEGGRGENERKEREGVETDDNVIREGVEGGLTGRGSQGPESDGER